MQKGKIANGANADGTVNDDTVYVPESWNDNIGNLFKLVENAGYTLIDDDGTSNSLGLQQVTKAVQGLYNPAFTYNTSSIVTQTVDDIVTGSDGKRYKALDNGIIGDNPVGSVTGKWEYYNPTTEDEWVANDSRAKTALNASGLAPIYATRAWVNFNGQGVISIRDSGNISSVSDGGVGNPQLNFIEDMPNADYSASFMGSSSITNQLGAVWYREGDVKTVSALELRTSQLSVTGSNVAVDLAEVCVNIIA